MSDTRNSFEDSSRYCQNQEAGKLITISNQAQYNIISTYTKLYTLHTLQPYWVGLRYSNSSVLTDIDGVVVDAGLFNLEYRPNKGDCVSVIYSINGNVKFSQMDCSQVNNFICLKKWPGKCLQACCPMAHETHVTTQNSAYAHYTMHSTHTRRQPLVLSL